MKCVVPLSGKFQDCRTCLIKGICDNCAKHCHQGHNGYYSNYSDSKGHCICKHEPPLKESDIDSICESSKSSTSVLLPKQHNVKSIRESNDNGKPLVM